MSKITFGAEPKDYEVYDYMLKNWKSLRFSPAVSCAKADQNHINPKRMQRMIKRQLKTEYIGTKAQQALQLQREQSKRDSKLRTKELKESEKNRKFELRQEKKKARHRGH